jgi:hypothetical protein
MQPAQGLYLLWNWDPSADVEVSVQIVAVSRMCSCRHGWGQAADLHDPLTVVKGSGRREIGSLSGSPYSKLIFEKG